MGNGVQDAATIPVGTRLAVPVLIPYVLKKGESISSVAGVFYGNTKVYQVIINASQIMDPTRVPAGSVLKIPYVMPRPIVKKISCQNSPKTGAPKGPQTGREKTRTGSESKKSHEPP